MRGSDPLSNTALWTLANGPCIVNSEIAKEDIPMVMTLDQIRAALADRRLAHVAHATKLSRSTLADIRAGRNQNPSLRTMRALTAYLSRPVGRA